MCRHVLYDGICERGKKNEEVIEDKGVKVLLMPMQSCTFLGTEMDYKTDKFSSQFIFKNPNETERCGCGRVIFGIKTQ